MLAKLDLKDNEIELYSQQLTEVLAHLDSLNLATKEIAASGLDLSRAESNQTMVLRKDEAL